MLLPFLSKHLCMTGTSLHFFAKVVITSRTNRQNNFNFAIFHSRLITQINTNLNHSSILSEKIVLHRKCAITCQSSTLYYFTEKSEIHYRNNKWHLPYLWSSDQLKSVYSDNALSRNHISQHCLSQDPVSLCLLINRTSFHSEAISHPSSLIICAIQIAFSIHFKH